MNYGTIKRPKAPNRKINTSEDFELCLLRHQYFRRANYNPTQEEMSPYMNIVEHFAKNTFFTYYNLFKTVGFYHDDIVNIGRVHLTSFIGLYSLERDKEKRDLYIQVFANKNFRDPGPKDFENKNKANFTLFLKQRMEELVRICRQKSRNIRGKLGEEYIVFAGSNKPPKNYRKILKDHHDLGYKKVDFAVFKSIRKKAEVNADATIFNFDGLWYVAIPLDQSNLTIEDIIGSGSNPYENSHNLIPDDLYDQKEFSELFDQFNSKSDYRKRVVLRNFIAKNKNKSYYKEEVSTAKKMLKSLDL